VNNLKLNEAAYVKPSRKRALSDAPPTAGAMRRTTVFYGWRRMKSSTSRFASSR